MLSSQRKQKQEFLRTILLFMIWNYRTGISMKIPKIACGPTGLCADSANIICGKENQF
ncbi:hypothetical protein KKC32_03510 [Patescibacteria group bacterium]|nr:hypothetical protein [Patescibacteria group bacterium]